MTCGDADRRRFLGKAGRFAALVVLAWWWGGFTLYAGVVVPVGSHLLGATAQGFVTQRVTRWLEGLTALALAVMAPGVWRRRAWAPRAAWWTILLTLSLQWILHRRLDSQLDGATHQVLGDGGQFYQVHRWYLWCACVQWCGGLILLWSAVTCAEEKPHPPDEA